MISVYTSLVKYVGGTEIMNDAIRFIAGKAGYVFLNLHTLKKKYYSFEQIKSFPSRESFFDDVIASLDGPRYETILSIKEEYSDKNAMIQVHPTYNCNYHCSYCFQNDRKHVQSNLSPDDIDRIEQFYHLYETVFSTTVNITRVTISGGEPLLPEIRPFIRAALRHWDDIPIVIITNGTLIDESIDLLRSHPNLYLSVSLDGTEAMHYAKRIPSNKSQYSDTIHGIQNALSFGIPVSISSVFHPDYVLEYPRFFDQIDSLGWFNNPKVSFTFGALISGIGSASYDFDETINIWDSLLKLKQMDERVNHFNTSSLTPGCEALVTSFKNSQNGFYSPYRCLVLNSPSYSFFPDGSISFCSTIHSQDSIIGTLRPSVYIDIERIASLHDRTTDRLPICSDCYKRALCKGNCPASSIAYSHKYDGHYCGIWENEALLQRITDYIFIK